MKRPLCGPLTLHDDEEDTSIFNMGIALDAAGSEAIFNFGAGPNPAPSAGSTFTTHQQQQAEQELAEKRMSQMQFTDLSPQRATLGATDMVCLLMAWYLCSCQTASNAHKGSLQTLFVTLCKPRACRKAAMGVCSRHASTCIR